MAIIEPRILKGFRDYLPREAISRRQLMGTIEKVFHLFGFVPIDTPALEYTDILLGKGSEETDKQLYRFEDNGGRDVALRFDLTVPLARFISMHQQEVGIPFRRYHIAPVWRAEKPQKGRFREFVQCDADIIGAPSTLADAEVVSLMCTALRALKVPAQVRVNNRVLLDGVLDAIGIPAENRGIVLRTVDKLEKLGEEVVIAELKEKAFLGDEQIPRVMEFLALGRSGLSSLEILTAVEQFAAESERAKLGLTQLRDVISMLGDLGHGDSEVRVDVSVARGLDYYTGIVFETALVPLPSIGSVCSGGRYDNLTSIYSKRALSGVGTSFGVDRLLAGLEELSLLQAASTTAVVFIPVLDDSSRSLTLGLAREFREAGIGCETSISTGKLGNQLGYASSKGYRFAVIAGEREFSQGVAHIKLLSTGEQLDAIPRENLVAEVSRRLPE